MTAFARPSDGPWSRYSRADAVRANTDWVGDAGRDSFSEWARSLSPEQAEKDASGHWLIRGDAEFIDPASGRSVRLQDALQPTISVPESIQQMRTTEQAARESAMRAIVAGAAKLLRERPSLAPKYGAKHMAAIVARFGDTIRQLKLPVSKASLYEKEARIRSGEPQPCFDRVGKCGRPRGELHERLRPIVNTAYLAQGRTQRAALRDAQVMAHECGIPAPTRHQVARYIDEISLAERTLAREGERGVRELQPRIRRDYSRFRWLDVVCVDGSVLNFYAQRMTRKGLIADRLTLIVFLDFATRMVVGWAIDNNERRETTGRAARMAFCEHGIPATLYVDNGSALMAGMALIASGLAVPIANSIPGQPASRGSIERFFGTIDDWARRVPFYCGRNIAEKPEDVESYAKAHPEECWTREQVEASFGAWLESEYHERPHSGDGMNGLSPRQKRDALLRSETRSIPRASEAVVEYLSGYVVGPRVVHEDGISFEGRLYGHFDQSIGNLIGRKVWLRMDPDDASFAVLCEDEQGRPLLENGAPLIATSRMLRGTSHDEIREAAATRAGMLKAARRALESREFLLKTGEQQVLDVKAKRAAEARRVEREQHGDAAPNVRIVGSELAPAAAGVQQRKRKAPPSLAPREVPDRSALAALANMARESDEREAPLRSRYAALAEMTETEAESGGPSYGRITEASA